MGVPSPTRPGGKQRWVEELGPYLTMGIQLALGVVVFFFLGRWLDGALGTSPWLMIAGLVLGSVGGLVKFLRDAAALGRRANDEAKERRRQGHEA